MTRTFLWQVFVSTFIRQGFGERKRQAESEGRGTPERQTRTQIDRLRKREAIALLEITLSRQEVEKEGLA